MTRRDWGDVALLAWLALTLVVVGAAWFEVIP